MTRACLGHPRLALAVILSVTAFFCVGIADIRTEVGYRAFLGSGHPVVTTLDGFIERYGDGLPLSAVWTCRSTEACRSVFDPAALEMAYSVSRDLAVIEGVTRVDSPATSRLAVSDALGTEARRFVEFGEPVPDRDTLRTSALADPLWTGRIVSADGTAGAIVAGLDSSSSERSVGVYAALRNALEPYEDQGFDFAFVGAPVEFIVAGGELEADVRRLVPVMVAIIGAVILVVFRSLAQTAAVLITVGVAAIWTIGLTGWLSWPQTSMSQVLAPLVLVMGVCDAVHLVAAYDRKRTANSAGRSTSNDPAEPLREAVSEIALPALITSLTTAAGLLSFAASSIASLAHVGIAGAVGVLVALLLTFTLLPVLLLVARRVPPGAVRASEQWRAPLVAVQNLAISNRRTMAVATALGIAISIVGLSRVSFEADFEDLYGRDSNVVRWAEFAAEHLRNPETIEVDLLLPPGQSIAGQENIEVLKTVENELRSIPDLSYVLSIATVIEHVASTSPTYGKHGRNTPPSTRQNETLIERFAGFDRRAVDEWITADRRGARLSTGVGKLPQDLLSDVVHQVDGAVASLVPPSWGVTTTGTIVVVQKMLDEIRRTQFASFGLAALLVFVILWLFVGSPYLAALAMLPTVAAAAIVLGLMGLSGIALDVGTAMVAAIVLGVGVDDAVHLLCRHRRLVRTGMHIREAMSEAVADVGRAIVATSVALAVGFVSLTSSAWGSISAFGLVAAIAIAVALLTTLLLLPPLVVGNATNPR